MRGRDYREKASDVFNRSTLIFGTKGTFAEAFPELAEVDIYVEESDFGTRKRTHRYTQDRPPGEFIDCSNPMCYRGGFSIGSVLRNMVYKKAVEDSGNTLCRGYEGSPKGRKKYRDCLHFFEYKVRLSYREPPGP